MVQAGSQGARGSGAHPRADVQDDLQGNSWALLHFPLSPLQNMWGMGGDGGGRGGVCSPQRAHEKEVLSSSACSPLPPQALSASGRLFPSHVSEVAGRS